MGGTNGRKDPWKLELGYLVEFQVSPQVFFCPRNHISFICTAEAFLFIFRGHIHLKSKWAEKSPENTIVALYAALVKKGVSAMPIRVGEYHRSFKTAP